MKEFGIVISLLIFWLFSINGQYYFEDIVYGLCFLSIISSIPIFKRIGIFPGMFYLYTVINGIVWSFKFPSPFKEFGFAGENYFKYSSAQGVLIILLSFPLLSLSGKKTLEYLKASLPWICIVSSAITICDYFHHGMGDYRPVGISGNATMDPSLIGILFPMILPLIKSLIDKNIFFIILYFLPVIAISLSMSSIGFGAIILSALSVMFFAIKSRNFRSVLYTFIPIFFILIIGRLHSHRELMHDSFRFYMYNASFHWFLEKTNILIGAGLGSFWGLGTIIGLSKDNIAHTTQSGTFPWLHSDWLQIGFELGIIGFILSVLSAISIIRICLKNNRFYICSSLISYCGVMLFNMPIHWWWSLFAGAVLICVGTIDDSEYDLA